MKPVLHLNLKRQWFNLIKSGEKKEEYREIKPYWNGRLCPYVTIKGKYYHPKDVQICFSNGYSKNRDQFFIECEGVKVGEGRKDWGAVENEQYYVILLGDIVSK